MNKRTFGVEIEFGTVFGGSTADCYDDPDYCCGDCTTASEVENMLERAGFGAWADDLHPDGTEWEISSPILRGEAGLNEVRAVMELLTSNGCYVTSEDGLHVHHGGDEFLGNDSLVERLVDSWTANQELIDTFVYPKRRGDYWACSAWDERKLARFKADIAGGELSYYGRGNLNVDALRSHGTIEIRQHEGTLDPDVAIAWIRFGQRFIQSVVNRATPLTCADTAADLLRAIRLPVTAQTILNEKALTMAGVA